MLNSTIAAPARDHIPDPGMPPSPEEVVQRLNSPDGGSPPEYVVDLRLTDGSRGHLLVGISAEALEDQLGRFESPLRWSALQIAVICVAMLAGFSAYIVFLNERARALLAQLQEESRLAYVGTLAAGIAHEVRNPLSSVKMNVQMMENRLKQLGDTEQADYFRGKIERIKGEVDRLEDSVSHFLTFARPQPLRLENVKLNDVVDDVLELLGPQCQSKGVGLSRKYARDLPLVAIDPRQFSQAIQNLILNALQALGRGGTITIATRAAEGAILFSVTDDGPGIPEELQSQIFDVFFTTREGGTGLGLNIVSRIVEEHRGKLRLESRPGEGATFTIELSLAPEATDEP